MPGTQIPESVRGVLKRHGCADGAQWDDWDDWLDADEHSDSDADED